MVKSWRIHSILLLVLSAPFAHATAPPPPAAAFFDNAEYTGAMLSPSAKYMAVRIAPSGGRQRQRLAIVTLADSSVKVIASFDNADVNYFYWVNDDRLVFNASDSTAPRGEDELRWGLWAVNRDGREMRQLAMTEARGAARPYQPWNTILLGGAYPLYPAHLYVAQFDLLGGRIDTLKLFRLNTINGKADRVQGPPDVRFWTFGGLGSMIAHTYHGTSNKLHFRSNDSDPWRELASFDLLPEPGFSTFIGEDRAIYVNSLNGKDKSSLYKMDPATGQLATAPLFSAGDFDFSGWLIESERLLGVRYLGDAQRSHWFDEKMKGVQAKVDGALPATVNNIHVASHPQTPWVLVTSQSATHPLTYWAFNSEANVLAEIGTTRPRIDPARMSKTMLVRYKARDGLEIPAWLTIPRASASKDLPMVVLVHDGPFRRGGSLDWDSRTQFLASRGYAVLEPEYRGSTGYGAAHYRAGWKQWGLKMQDDLADGARWAISQGIANANRICIAGSGYGGYGALMGVAKDGDLFQCAVSFGAMTDLRRMLRDNWVQTNTTIDEVNRYSMDQLIGDPKADAARLEAASPIEIAARIQRPLLLAHGESDYSVPIQHGKSFRITVSKTNSDVEWIEYQGETHELTLSKNRIDFWTRVERFLDKHIGQKNTVRYK